MQELGFSHRIRTMLPMIPLGEKIRGMLVVVGGVLFGWLLARIAPPVCRPHWPDYPAKMHAENFPKSYRCQKIVQPIHITGRGDDSAWKRAPWTDLFVDIEGYKKPLPRFRTRAKMLWDDQFLYVFAEMEEPHVWGTLTEKNAIIFHDNDFEVFIDPDSSGENYYEFEMNALNTIWELTLVKRYTQGGPAIHGTNLPGLISAVHVDGTLNDPSDTDRGWSVEIAFPFTGLAKHRLSGACPPLPGDRWRINFSRVEWTHEIVDGKYQKIPKAKKNEDNWVWSPQGLIDMHQPEHWGNLDFVE
jgi:hypothetical protein